MLYTLTYVRDNLRNREGKRVFYLGKGDQLTSDARDWLTAQRIEILPAEKAAVEVYRLLGGGEIREKPEDMTQLSRDILVKKTHPRIKFRGAMDTLEGEMLLCCRLVPEYGRELRELLELSRKLVRWEVLEEPANMPDIWGMTPEEIRKRSHFPQKFYGIPHFMPQPEDPLEILHLNRLRCAVRAAELTAAEAFRDRDGYCTRPDILQCLNRLSSMVYLLMLRHKGEGK